LALFLLFLFSFLTFACGVAAGVDELGAGSNYFYIPAAYRNSRQPALPVIYTPAARPEAIVDAK
jgi:hypothetical protein